MARPRTTISDLKDRISELENENSELTETLDQVYELVAPSDEEGEESEEEEE